ncbi:Uncharacterised protein [Mycobacterium tuberculosis]|nr:Uncharacterised protein [Mycobacterium tuberculosis]
MRLWLSAVPAEDNPDSCSPTLPMPETTAGVPGGNPPVLYSPDTPEPKFSTPDPSEPKLAKPEPAPATSVCAWFHQPELPAPKFPKPDTPPSPELKKPDDGAVVVLPKPGVAGILTPLIRIGPTVTLAPRFSGMRSIVIGGGLKPSIWPSMSIVSGSGAAGMVKPGIVNPSVPIDALASSASGLLGILMPFGKIVTAGVLQLTVTGNDWLILVSILRLPNWRVTLPARSLISIPEMLTTPKPKKGPTGKVVLKF